jgi:hypothetical protein
MTARKKKSRPKQKATRTSTAATKKIPALFSGSSIQPTRAQAQRDKNAAVLAALAPMTIAMLERQAAKDVRDVERFEEEPMISAPVWHVHQK